MLLLVLLVFLLFVFLVVVRLVHRGCGLSLWLGSSSALRFALTSGGSGHWRLLLLHLLLLLLLLFLLLCLRLLEERLQVGLLFFTVVV